MPLPRHAGELSSRKSTTAKSTTDDADATDFLVGTPRCGVRVGARRSRRFNFHPLIARIAADFFGGKRFVAALGSQTALKIWTKGHCNDRVPLHLRLEQAAKSRAIASCCVHSRDETIHNIW
jgi:hypothetical protein